MSAVEPVDVFINNLVTLCAEPPENSENPNIPEAIDFDGDASQFMTCTIDSAKVKNISDNPGTRPVDEEHVESAGKHDENSVNSHNLQARIPHPPVSLELRELKVLSIPTDQNEENPLKRIKYRGVINS